MDKVDLLPAYLGILIWCRPMPMKTASGTQQVSSSACPMQRKNATTPSSKGRVGQYCSGGGLRLVTGVVASPVSALPTAADSNEPNQRKASQRQ